MECKSKWAFHQARKNIELIDTLWNVNHLNLPHLSVSGGELIDTLWNVNSGLSISRDGLKFTN